MINKPRFRKGKKAAKRMPPDSKAMSPKQWKLFRRYGTAIANWQIKVIEQRRQALRASSAAACAALTAVQISMIQQQPILKDGTEDHQRKMKAIALAEAMIVGAQSIAKTMATWMLIFFLVTSCVTVPKGHNHSRKQHRLETTPKAQ